jgi:hypothetical protein
MQVPVRRANRRGSGVDCDVRYANGKSLPQSTPDPFLLPDAAAREIALQGWIDDEFAKKIANTPV